MLRRNRGLLRASFGCRLGFCAALLQAQVSAAAPGLDVDGLVDGNTHVVSESGRSIAVTLSLADDPAADVSVAITASESGMIETIPAGPIVFADSSYPENKTIVIRGLDNSADEENGAFDVTFTTSSSDGTFDGLTKTFTFQNKNNDGKKGNKAPTAIVIYEPKDEATQVTHSDQYSVEVPYDADGDDLTLTICRDTQANFEGSPTCMDYEESLSTANLPRRNTQQALLAGIVALILMAVFLRQRAFSVLLLLILLGCGSENLLDSFKIKRRPRWNIDISGLAASTTYYWKAYVMDGKGHIVESSTHSYTSGATP